MSTPQWPTLEGRLKHSLIDKEQARLQIERMKLVDTSKFYLVGGCVRDELLGIPCKDYDFVVLVSSFEEMKMEIIKNGGEIFLEKPEFQVIRAKFPTYGAADFALPRKDGTYSDGRHPDKTEIAQTLYEDSCRRDATINAMYKNISTGEIIDYHHGEEDLKNCVIRAVGNPEDRIKEDSLRLLRFFRFAITKKFNLSNDLYRCYLYSEYTSLLKNVSPERIREEIFKCFKYDMHTTLELLCSPPYRFLYNEIFNSRTNIKLKPTMEDF